MPIKPLQNYVLIKPIHSLEESMQEKAGIILPTATDTDPDNSGTILALGEAVTLPLKKGDKVLFKPHLFEALSDGQEIVLLGREDAVMAHVD